VAKGNADEMTGYGMGCGAWGTAEVWGRRCGGAVRRSACMRSRYRRLIWKPNPFFIHGSAYRVCMKVLTSGRYCFTMRVGVGLDQWGR
jgi:hypothetical protein